MSWTKLVDGREVPAKIITGHIVDANGERKCRALCFPDGTTYTRKAGDWIHYMRGLGETFEPTRGRRRRRT